MRGSGDETRKTQPRASPRTIEKETDTIIVGSNLPDADLALTPHPLTKETKAVLVAEETIVIVATVLAPHQHPETSVR